MKTTRKRWARQDASTLLVLYDNRRTEAAPELSIHSVGFRQARRALRFRRSPLGALRESRFYPEVGALVSDAIGRATMNLCHDLRSLPLGKTGRETSPEGVSEGGFFTLANKKRRNQTMTKIDAVRSLRHLQWHTINSQYHSAPVADLLKTIDPDFDVNEWGEKTVNRYLRHQAQTDRRITTILETW